MAMDISGRPPARPSTSRTTVSTSSGSTVSPTAVAGASITSLSCASVSDGTSSSTLVVRPAMERCSKSLPMWSARSTRTQRATRPSASSPRTLSRKAPRSFGSVWPAHCSSSWSQTRTAGFCGSSGPERSASASTARGPEVTTRWGHRSAPGIAPRPRAGSRPARTSDDFPAPLEPETTTRVLSTSLATDPARAPRGRGRAQHPQARTS